MKGSDEERPPADEDAALESAWDAFLAGQLEEALVEAARAADVGGRSILESRVYLELGMLQAAEGAIARTIEALGAEDVEARELSAELALARWDFDSARALFASIEGDWTPETIERMALIADHDGRFEEGDRLLALARESADAPSPPRMSDEQFDAAVEAALHALAPDVTERLANVRIVREPLPFRALLDPDDRGATPPDILGFFVGATIHEGGDFTGTGELSGELPPTIYLFQRNLERAAHDEEELAEEIKITLYHEIGHLLGLDEDEVAALGLE